jgi:small-conductance mechanosensitive channel
MENFNINPALVENIIYGVIIIVVALLVVMVLNRGVSLLAKHLNMPMLACRPLRLVVRYAVLLISIGLVLRRFGFDDMDTVLKIVGTILGLVAIGFVATWSILSHFLCTFVLILFKPFSIGDEIEIPGDSVTGKVVDITMIFTTLQSSEGEYIQIPNNMFFQKIFKRRVGANAIDLAHQLRQEKPAE